MTRTNSTGGSGTALYSRPTTRLFVVSVYAVAAAAILWRFEGLATAVRIPIALPLLLFAPGYAILSALVPAGAGAPFGAASGDPTGGDGTGISTLERTVLAVVTSMALVPMIAIVVNAAMGIRLGPILAAAAAVTVLGALLGAVRSGHARSVDADSTRSVVGDLRRSLADPLTVVAVILTVLLLGSSAALVVTGNTAESLDTQFYFVDGSETDASGATYDLRVAQDDVANQRYTVVVTRGDDTPGEELDRFSVEVSSGETVERTYRVSESDLDSATTVRFLLYTGDAPASPDPSTAHRTLRRTVTTTE